MKRITFITLLINKFCRMMIIFAFVGFPGIIELILIREKSCICNCQLEWARTTTAF